MQLVHLTIALDPSGYVGGPINALELTPSEGIHWVHREPNCPASN